MNGLIYLVGLIVVVMIILSFFRTALKEFRRWARARFAMNVDQSSPVIVGNNRLRYVQWGPVVAGSLLAAALAFVLSTFAVAIGLGVSSTAPTWRDASVGLILLSALYLFLVAFVSYGVGAYLAGRVSTRRNRADAADIEYSDGVHGLLVWAIATLLAGLLALGATQAVSRIVAPSGGQTGPEASVAGENIIAFDLDRLFRSDRPQTGDMSYTR